MSTNQTRAPVVRTTRLRNDTRWLLRSRPLQAALVLVAGLQVVAVAGSKGENKPASTGAGLVRQAMSAQAPVSVIRAPAAVVQAPVKKVAAAPKTARKTQADRKLAAAEELAAKYRRNGYSVSPSLARQIHQAAVANRIDPRLAFGLVRTESGFKNSATSPVGAVGLTQLMPSTARWMERGVTRTQLRNPEVNLRIGFRYLRELIEKYDGDTDLALTAYNRGPGTVDRVLKRGGDPDNGYADMVMGRNTRRRHR